MAKLRLAKGKKVSGTKTAAAKYVNIFGQRVKVGTKKYEIMMQQKKQFDDMNKYEGSTTGNVTLKKSNYFKNDERYVIFTTKTRRIIKTRYFEKKTNGRIYYCYTIIK
jgi:hypothetical protein